MILFLAVVPNLDGPRMSGHSFVVVLQLAFINTYVNSVELGRIRGGEFHTRSFNNIASNHPAPHCTSYSQTNQWISSLHSSPTISRLSPLPPLPSTPKMLAPPPVLQAALSPKWLNGHFLLSQHACIAPNSLSPVSPPSDDTFESRSFSDSCNHADL